MTERKIRWGILATGAIAKAFAKGLQESQSGCLVAVGSRTQERASDFAAAWGGVRAHGSYEALLADPEVEAVYVATPHTQHPEWVIKAAEAGKHILVEKPMAINQYLAQAMIDAALANKVFLMEAYMYRCHPQTARLVELLREGAIGEVAVIQATFSFRAGHDPEKRIWNNALGGGGILDVGGYATSIARLIAGAAQGQAFAEPAAVTGAGRLHPETGVDMWAVGTLQFASGIVATVATGVGVAQENVVRIFGSQGSILLPSPYCADRAQAAPGRIVLRRQGEAPREIEVPAAATSYAYEADVCGRAIRAGRLQAEAPAMTWGDSLGNLRAQDAWRAAIGLAYKCEQPEHADALTAANRPLRRRADAPCPAGRIAHLDKPLSRLVMGVDNQLTMPHAFAVFDDYYERGGNVFDTAYVYGREKSRLLGRWLAARGVRDEVVVIAKGAHTPYCDPESVARQLDEQLEWLGLEYADIYMLHRDNPKYPAGRFVEALNKLAQAGRIKAFGGSNWTLERVRQANAYARRKGLQGFSVVSNNLALAEMVQPVWAGCLHVHDRKSLAFLKRSQLALLPWSSQARGFFVPERASPENRSDVSLATCWYSEENFKRQARAIELAARKGVEPVNIALAWVLHQPFPTFPLIGPRQIAETRSCFAALQVELTPRECRYLNLEI